MEGFKKCHGCQYYDYSWSDEDGHLGSCERSGRDDFEYCPLDDVNNCNTPSNDGSMKEII